MPSNRFSKKDYYEKKNKFELDGVGAKIDLDKDYLVVMNHPDTYDFKSARINTNKILDAVKKNKYTNYMVLAKSRSRNRFSFRSYPRI